MEKQRIDKWLWAARFYKTRSIAGDAVRKGRIAVNGQSVKPARTIAIGDTVTIQRSPYRTTVIVQGLNDARRPAREAVLLYQETEESVAKRQQLAEKLRDDQQIRRGLAGDRRPDKRQRRQIIRFQSAPGELPDPELPDQSED